jgi:hypothetical protein
VEIEVIMVKVLLGEEIMVQDPRSTYAKAR